ncbi:mechanosensitive ion channel family protein [Cohnella thailandensis]|uniref:Mechanosensitive ion channel family protein n=1 Tax=Cohnella thailandensis TaxID=557557 RepID=A0A841STQ0_9BACL|nr:mechanosensitive ion channel family protein [Cohnella thailandensis]MBB6633007.1 mechanosensitive ion channel family protein [Cohnella thailandensis]MBP1975298.1 MscS family membrane protein [Cohnella thailandensis]
MDWLETFIDRIRGKELLIALGIVFLFYLISLFFTRLLLPRLLRRWAHGEDSASWMNSVRKPSHALFLLIGIYAALEFYVPSGWAHEPLLQKIVRSLAVFFASWALYNIAAVSSAVFQSIYRRLGKDESSMLIPFLSKVIRFLIGALALAAIATDWGFNVNGVVAGMGLGSLAVALAAKDTLSNVIGGIVIITEKPFSKGDWILTPSVEGFVEDITFRSSKIRTFADSVVTVPNATLASQPITNWSRMGKRRVTYTFGVALDTDPVALERAVSRIEMELRLNDEIHPDLVMVRFNEFMQGSLGIFIYFFTNTTVWVEHTRIRQDINFMILEVLASEGIKLAYPIQRVLLESEASERRFPVEAGL